MSVSLPPSYSGARYRVGEFQAGAFANGLSATVRTWEPQGSRPTLGDDNSIDYDSEFCTRYLFYVG